MKIFLTGGSGFLGSYLNTHLSKTHDVTAPLSRELNLEDYTAVKKFFSDKKFDIVIHAAGKGRDNVEADDTDVMYGILTSFFNIHSNRSHFYKLINFGSGAEFGLASNIDCVKEDDVVNAIPTGSYGIAKNYIANVIRGESHYYNLRIFSCFGPSESENRLLPKFIRTIESGNVFEIANDRYVDFVNIKDVAITVDAVIAHPITDKDVNIVYQNKLRVSEILNKYCLLHNINPLTAFRVSGTSNKNYTGNGDKLAKYNLPFVGLDEGLKAYKGK